MLDYGIALKCNDGVIAFKKLIALLKLLMLLNWNPVKNVSTSNSYIQSIMLQVRLLHYQFRANLPMYEMFKKRLSLFNEEAGELSFSVLSRCVLGDTTKHQLDHMCKMYNSIHDHQAISRDLQEDNGMRMKEDTSWRHEYNSESRPVVETLAFVRQHLRTIRQGQHTIYDGKAAGYQNATSARGHQVVPNWHSSYWGKRAVDMFDLQWAKVGQKFEHTDFGQKVHNVWPEMMSGNSCPDATAESLNSFFNVDHQDGEPANLPGPAESLHCDESYIESTLSADESSELGGPKSHDF